MNFTLLPIPTPADSTGLYKLADIMFENEPGLTVFWDKVCRRPIFRVSNKDFQANGDMIYDEYGPLRNLHGEPIWDEPLHVWWAQKKDSNICESLSFFLRMNPLDMVFTDLFVFKKPGHGKVADDQLDYEIYECEWSDFACEGWKLEFNVWNNHYTTHSDKYQRYEKAYISLMKTNNEDGFPPYEFQDGGVDAEVSQIFCDNTIP